jgi:hypothetical protein
VSLTSYTSTETDVFTSTETDISTATATDVSTSTETNIVGSYIPYTSTETTTTTVTNDVTAPTASSTASCGTGVSSKLTLRLAFVLTRSLCSVLPANYALLAFACAPQALLTYVEAVALHSVPIYKQTTTTVGHVALL